jgi:hypothetical protein
MKKLRYFSMWARVPAGAKRERRLRLLGELVGAVNAYWWLGRAPGTVRCVAAVEAGEDVLSVTFMMRRRPDAHARRESFEEWDLGEIVARDAY